jgi:hypothetical protein
MTQEAQENWTQELEECLRETRMGAEEMQAALMTRETDRILKAVEAQERSAERLGRLSAGAGAPDTDRGSVPDSACVRLDDGTRGLLLKTQSVLRRNRLLASRFLDVIGRTLYALDPGQSVMGAYNAGGRPAPVSGPRLVQRRV